MLIADNDDPFTSAVEAVFAREFDVRTCQDGETALELLLNFRPDVLILNLSLPFKDGLTVLQEAAYSPPVILAITTYLSPYIEQACAALGIGYLLRSPTVNTLRVRVMDMVGQWKSGQIPPDLRTQVSLHLHILNFPTHRAGYWQLCEAIPLFYQDPDQNLNTVLYPKVALICNRTDGRAVEHTIRSLIEHTWKQRDPITWAKYFPNQTECPSNKVFFDALANMLTE
jgi:CheY-like chemotaxis protein